MDRSESERVRRGALITSLVANLGILGFFKYANFFADSPATLAATVGFPIGYVELEILLPIGISFYTFQSMSYTIDLYPLGRGRRSTHESNRRPRPE